MGFRFLVVPVTPFQQNCTILWRDDTKIGAVVDPGGDTERILAAVAEHGVKLEKILVTHGHLDHAGAVAALADDLKLPIEGPHEDERFWIDQLPDQTARYGFPAARAFTPDRWLNDGDRVTVGGAPLDVRHCPGHTPGHIVFFAPEERVAIVGDVLFQGSIGRTDFPRGNHGQLLESIVQKLWPLGDDVTFIPGHGATSTFGWERKTNPFVSDMALGHG